MPSEIEALKAKIEAANLAYRQGEAIMSDLDYEKLLDQLAELTYGQDQLLSQVGYNVASDDSRKEELPIPMFSMNKIKTLEELQKWAELKGISGTTKMIITPKLDGLSFCANENNGDGWTRGNGLQGQRSNAHIDLILRNKKKPQVEVPGFTYGEIIMQKALFEKKWAHSYRNSRNMGAGAMNRKEPEDLLNDFEFIRYGITLADGETMDKSAQLDFLNLHCNQVPIIYKTVELADIDDDMLESLFVTMGHEYEIDGLIIEINSLNLRNALGREKNGNPIFARAWKGFEANKKTTILLDINWQVSKHGLYKPVGKLQPIELDGVTVSNVTLINARFIKENSIGIGSKVEIIRSGQVIPKITQVLQEADPNLPTHCYSCKTLLTWNENEVELCCANPNCPEQRLQKMIAFFTILEVENLAQGIIEQLYRNGYDSVEKVLKMTAQDFEALDSFKEKKSIKIYKAIQEKTQNVPLEKIMHASSVFVGLGSKKLALLSDFNSASTQPTVEQLLAIDGFSDITAAIFVNHYAQFWEFIAPLPITIQSKTQRVTLGDKLEGLNVCFSGFRSTELEELLLQNSGKIASGISKNTTHLVMKSTGSGSSKEQKAEQLNIPIMTAEAFKSFLQNALSS